MEISINNNLANYIKDQIVLAEQNYLDWNNNLNNILSYRDHSINFSQSGNTSSRSKFYDSLEKLSNNIENTDNKIQKFFNGDASLIDTVIKTQEVTNQLKLILEIRNKFTESIEKIMNMSV